MDECDFKFDTTNYQVIEGHRTPRRLVLRIFRNQAVAKDNEILYPNDTCVGYCKVLGGRSYDYIFVHDAPEEPSQSKWMKILPSKLKIDGVFRELYKYHGDTRY